MDIELRKGIVVGVNLAEQPNEWLINAAVEIADMARKRGLELPVAAGAVAVEGAQQNTEAEADNKDFDVKEAVSMQLLYSYEGYHSIADSLNEGRRKIDQVDVVDKEIVIKEFKSWFSEEKQAYVASAMENDLDLHFTLVAAPNVIASAEEIEELAKNFGKGQPYETYVHEPLYSQYIPEQLSGTHPESGSSVIFSLIPSKLDDSLGGTVAQQKARLTALKDANPFLKVPSVLEAVTYWQTLRASGNKLADSTAFDQTYIRHIDLEPKELAFWSCVPSSYVYDGGGPYLRRSNVDGDDAVRFSVG